MNPSASFSDHTTPCVCLSVIPLMSHQQSPSHSGRHHPHSWGGFRLRNHEANSFLRCWTKCQVLFEKCLLDIVLKPVAYRVKRRDVEINCRTIPIILWSQIIPESPPSFCESLFATEKKKHGRQRMCPCRVEWPHGLGWWSVVQSAWWMTWGRILVSNVETGVEIGFLIMACCISL